MRARPAPEASAESKGEAAGGSRAAAVGSGPFTLVHQRPTEIVFRRFDAYHEGPAGVHELRFKIVKDASTRLLKFRKGNAERGPHLAINALPLDKLKQFQAGRLAQNYRVVRAPGLSYQYLGFNLADEHLQKLAVRQAIARAIDVEALIAHRQRGYAVRASSPLPPQSAAAAQDIVPPPYDPQAARVLLAEAGYRTPDGDPDSDPDSDGDPERPTLTLTYKTTTGHAALAQARIIQADLAKVGIVLNIRSLDWGVFYDDVRKGAFQLFSLRWVGISEPGFLYELFHSRRFPPQGRNRVRYQRAEVDALLEQARLETEVTTRRRLYQEVQRMLAADLPYLSLWHSQNVAIVARRLRGFSLHPSGGFESLRGVHLGPLDGS